MSGVPSVSPDGRHPDREHLAAERARKKMRAQGRAERARRKLQVLVEKADEVFIEFSWLQRKQWAITTFVQALEDGYPRMFAYEIASVAARVDIATVRRYVKDWLSNDGFFTSANWGAHDYVPTFLRDEDIAEACREWWRDRAPKKGVSPRASLLLLALELTVVVCRTEKPSRCRFPAILVRHRRPA